MKLNITGGWVPYYKIGSFVERMGEPKPFEFSTKNFGNVVKFVTIDLQSQNPEKPFRNRTQDRSKDGWLIFCIVLDEELQPDNQSEVDRRIMQTVLTVLPKSFRRWKVSDFDAEGFLEELKLFFDNKLAP